jgi:hypothetical protein
MSGITKGVWFLDKLVCRRAKLSVYKKSGKSIRNVVSSSLYYVIGPYSDIDSLSPKMDIIKATFYRHWDGRND